MGDNKRIENEYEKNYKIFATPGYRLGNPDSRSRQPGPDSRPDSFLVPAKIPIPTPGPDLGPDFPSRQVFSPGWNPDSPVTTLDPDSRLSIPVPTFPYPSVDW
jgi:hypothetical protein